MVSSSSCWNPESSLTQQVRILGEGGSMSPSDLSLIAHMMSCHEKGAGERGESSAGVAEERPEVEIQRILWVGSAGPQGRSSGGHGCNVLYTHLLLLLLLLLPFLWSLDWGIRQGRGMRVRKSLRTVGPVWRTGEALGGSP